MVSFNTFTHLVASLKAPSPNVGPLGVRASPYGFWEITSHSVTPVLLCILKYYFQTEVNSKKLKSRNQTTDSKRCHNFK